jgi:hypothetical protein
MRRIFALLFVLALAAPVAATGSVRAPGDGTLSVRDLDGYVWVRAQGAIIGRCDECTFRLDDLTTSDAGVPLVTGWERARDVDGDGSFEWFRGRDVRWRVIGGRYLLRVHQGRDIDLSVVGKGLVKLRGTAGTFALNDSDPITVTPELHVMQLAPVLAPA